MEVKAQVVNYVQNPGFENVDSPFVMQNSAKFWKPLNTLKPSYFVFSTKPDIATAPGMPSGYQMPRNGNNLVIMELYCDTPECLNPSRFYARNVLQHSLMAGKTYCAKFWVVATNNSPLGVSNIGIYFGGNELDTIKYSTIPITYLTPQIKNGPSNFISDTLNWTAISGTFVATGAEKYMVIGNFDPMNQTNSVVINSWGNASWEAIYVDDVSLFDVDLPADAGPDKTCIPGDSVFIGRTPDVEIDESCQWYQLPDTSTPIATVAGLYVKPVTTTTYVVRQQLWCSGVKWDTVVVYEDHVNLKEISLLNRIEVYPSPVSDYLKIKTSASLQDEEITISVVNHLGQVLSSANLSLPGETSITVADLPQGVYSVRLCLHGQSLHRKVTVVK
jgi:hypothetical protein